MSCAQAYIRSFYVKYWINEVPLWKDMYDAKVPGSYARGFREERIAHGVAKYGPLGPELVGFWDSPSQE